ncbi:MAG: sensory rhodopsin transducer [bacterium]|nr:sensory rhodopsin transducer [bacterium]
MSNEIGEYIWLIPDAYLPPYGDPELPSHESTCILNVNKKSARVKFTFYFEDQDPIESNELEIPPERTLHVRLDKAKELLGVELRTNVPFAIKVESDTRIVVQHSRMDTRQSNLAYMTSMGYPVKI